MKATAIAPANIAFIKYWGKADRSAGEAGEELRIPLNDSFSMNLSGAYTITTVSFAADYGEDRVELAGGMFSEAETARVIRGLDRMRRKAECTLKARVVTKNTFPKGAGSAASASGFAALTVAGFAALGLALSEKELSVFARLGSGSACRSIPDGFVVWEKGTDSESSYAYSVYPAQYWDIRDILVIVDKRMKKIPTSDGMELVATSPGLAARLDAVPGRMADIQKAMEQKDFARFGSIAEEDCLDMHAVMQSQTPPLMYWNEKTKMIMDAVRAWRNDGLPVYFTVDAGPNVHILCEGKDEKALLEKLGSMSGLEDIIRNTPAGGARLISDHLF